MKQFLTLVIVSVLCGLSHAQTTGSFQQTITFEQPDYSFTRTLYFHVPDNYDENKDYKLVVGFRGGPHVNAGQFRDQLAFLSDSLEAIIMCPENSGHFWNQEGLTKQLFRYSVDTTLAQYSIDTNFIYLTGLSYGGRHAVIVSMDTDNGPIPPLRGVIPFAAGSDSQLEPDYNDIEDFPPACICIGLNDSQNFITVSQTIHADIQANGGTSLLNEIPGVGHTVAFPTYPQEMMKCLNFIEDHHQSTAIKNHSGDIVPLSIVPNPATDLIALFGPDPGTVLQVDILTHSGVIVKSITGYPAVISVAPFPPGMYWVSLITPSGPVTRPLVILE